jgi:hypothetical protein
MLNLEKIDLGGFGIAEEDEEIGIDSSVQVKANMNEALKVNPDEHAKVTNLSEQSGVPAFAVDSDPDEVEHNLKLDNIDFDDMSKRTPNTAQYLTDYNNSVIAQDDIDVLQSIENIFDFGKTFENIGESITTAFSATGAGLRMAGVDMTPDRIEDLVPMGVMPIGMESEAINLSKQIAENYGITTDEQLQETKEVATQNMLAELRTIQEKQAELTPEDLNLVEQGVRAGIESLAHMAPGFGLMLLSGGRAAPLLTTIGVQTFGGSYGEGRAEGLTPQEASWFASIDAAIEVGTELLPTKTLETIITGQSKGLKKEALKFAIREMGTEQLATLGQTINSYAFGLDEQMSDPDLSVGEKVQIQLQRQAVTAIATVVAGGAQITAATGLRKSIEALTQDENAKQTKGQVEQQKIDTLNERSEKSKLRERDKESFRKFVEASDGENNTHVFIDGSQAALYLQEKTLEEIEADPALKLLSEQTREASNLGSDVQIPAGDFAADIAGTEHYTALRDSMTMSDEAVSPFRQEQVQQETETYVRTLMEEAQESASEYVEAQEIYTTVRDQLIDTGQVTPANASIMAQIVPAWATAQARRQGKSVTEVYTDAGLVIEGPQTGERARLEGEVVLEQGETYTPETPVYPMAPRSEWYGDADFAQRGGQIAMMNPQEYLDSVDPLKEDELTLENISDLQTHIEEGNQLDPLVIYETGKEDGRHRARAAINLGINEVPVILFGEQINRFPGVETVTQRATIPVEEEITDEQIKARREEADQREAQQTIIREAKARTDAEVLAEFNRAKAREQVAFTHRSSEEFTQFDDGLLGQNTTTPSANLGHYLSSEDVGNVERYGDALSVHQFTFENPLVIGAETFADVMGDLTIEEVAERREALMELGHDGILIEDLNWAIAFEGSTVTKLEEELEPFEQPTKEKRKPRGYYDPANSIIRLTESADLSTFLHEFAHFMYEMEVNGDTEMLQSINNWYKRNAKDVAKEAETYINGEYDAAKQGERVDEEPVTITPDDVTAFLDTDTTGNKDKDAAIRRAVHEQFARGFEAYLMEGKAPSIELRNAFRAFARWLSRIYQVLRGRLDVNLDAEMRAVFDRLLATEEQIQAAEARARVEPMFTDAAMAGMTEAEFADYQTRQEKVKDVQSETLRDKIIGQLTRQTKAWWKEEKQDIIDEETESLKKQQVYRSRAELRDGAFKIDHATVKELAGEEKTDKLGRKSIVIPPQLRGMTAKGMAGVHPDEAAAFFGYSSGSEMLNDLTTAPDIKVQAETNAEARMVDRHGDILTDGTIQKEADEAVANEERGKLILHELKMLARGTNAPVIERNTIKALAEERIGRLSFREIHPGKYRKAEIRAAQESTRMLAAGNREGAADAKMRQVMNYYLGMAATDAKNETTKIVDRMARYNKKKVREAIQTVEGGYWDQLTRILDRFEFRKSATLKEVESLNIWAKERTEVAGDGLVLSNAVLNESLVTHWKNVPFSDLQGINDSVKNIEHVARYANKLTRMQEEIDFNKLVDRWVTSMDEKVKTRFVSKRADVAEGRKWGRWFMAQMTKIPFMASWLDGGERAGLSHQIMVQPFTDAYNAEIKLWEAAGKPVMDAIEGRSKEDMKRHNRKEYIPEIDDNLYGHQIIAVALNTGNQSNLKKMLLGEEWADPENEAEITFDNPKLQAVLSRMTKGDWEMVQMIWDQMETLYPQLAEVHRRTTGLVPPKVEATPVTTEFGTFKGGYYPVKYDPNRDQRAALNEDKLNAETESMFSNNASIQVSVNAGATNERTGYYAPIRLSLDVVPAHFQETIHYITHHDPVREVNRLTRNKTVAQTIKEKLGPEEYAQLRPWLNDIAKDGREAPTKMFWDDLLQKLRFGVTLGTMGFKASTGIIQISGLSNSIAEVGMAPMMQSMRSILGSTTTIKQAWDFAVENSQVLEHRTQTMDREIRNAMKRIEGKRGVLAAAQEASMKHIALIQTYMVDLPSWHAAYIKGMGEWGDEARAFQYADWVIENVQGSGVTKDMARVMRGQSETGRMFTMFMTFFSSLWNMERDLVKGAKTGLYSTTNTAAKAMFLFTIPVLFEMMMRGELGEPEDDEDDRLQTMLTKTALFPVQSIPFIRDVASAVTGEFGYNISPLQMIIEQGTRTIPEIVTRGFTDDEITKGQVKGATKFIGAAVGVPGMNQMWATGEHMYDVIEEGEDLTMRELLFGPDRE